MVVSDDSIYLPTLPPYQDYIKTQGGMAIGWIILLLVFITLFYIAILILDIYSPIATQVVQFVLLTVVIVCAIPSITAFILASFVINISIVEIFNHTCNLSKYAAFYGLRFLLCKIKKTEIKLSLKQIHLNNNNPKELLL